ncbi:MAG TPA: HD domain-containing protein [Tepidisphaeraceae bacterium]|jgi:exopolyphosphatase/pppGpp-phosphohydrolase
MAEHQACALRRRAVERWAERRLGNIDHELRVLEIATALFDLGAGRHRLDPSHRKLLRLASLLHDVGRCKGAQNHHHRGARMVAKSKLPFDDAQRRALMYLTRHHRGRVPALGAERDLIARDDRAPLRAVLALLRAADALDNRSLAPPRLQFALQGRQLCIRCRLAEDSPKARRVFRRRKKFHLIEKLLGCKVELRIVKRRELVLA